MGQVKHILLYAFVSAILLACDRDPYFGPVYIDENDSTAIDSSALKLFVGCEGNFQLANASLSIISPFTKTSVNKAYETKNGQPLGDVMQSFHQVGDSIFLVINNSGLIRIIDKSTILDIGSISGFTSPRYMATIGHRAYVSDLFSQTISIVDLRSGLIEKEVNAGDWTERIIVSNNQLIVADINNKALLVFDTELHLVKSIALDVTPDYLFTSSDQHIVVCGRKNEAGEEAYALDFDEKFELVKSYELGALNYAVASEKSLYILGNSSVQQLDLVDFTMQNEFTINATSPYGLCINEAFDLLFVSDAKDYISKGEVLQYSLLDGELMHRYEVGFIPQAMHFAL